MSSLFYKKISRHDFKDDFIHFDKTGKAFDLIPASKAFPTSRLKKIAERPAEWHLIQPFFDGVHALANHSRPVFQQT